MKNILFTVLRVATLAIAFTVLFTIASSVTTTPELAQSMTQEQIAQSTAVLPWVSLTMTLVLSLALRSRWHGWKLGGAVVLYEIVYFSFGYYVAWRTPGNRPDFLGPDHRAHPLPQSLLAARDHARSYDRAALIGSSLRNSGHPTSSLETKAKKSRNGRRLTTR